MMLFFLSIVILSACSPYGLKDNPNQNVDEANESTEAELLALDDMLEFPVNIGQFEDELQLQNEDNLLSQTESGYIARNKLIEIDYKDERSDNSEPIHYIYVTIDLTSENFNEVEKDFTLIFERIFTALEVSYDMDELVTGINNGEIEAMESKDISVESTGHESIQLIISPK